MPHATPALALDFQKVALLLDVDGTMLDIAPSPLEVDVPPSLPRTLERLWERTSGALALVSGRPMQQLDMLFSPLQLPAIGGHGAEFRPAAHQPPTSRLPKLDAKVKRLLATIADADPGILAEDKGYSFALHYRHAPDKGETIRDQAASLCAAGAKSLEILLGKAVVEIKQSGFNKGSGVRELMTYAPFLGRRPVFIGDDITDEDVFAIMPEFDGIAISVGEKHPAADYYFGSPVDVRRWLEGLSQEQALVLT